MTSTDGTTTQNDRPSRFLYERIAEQIATAIDDGRIRDGERIPSVRATSRKFDCSVSAVLHAYEELERTGRIRAVPRSGYFACRSDSALLPSHRPAEYPLTRTAVRPVSMIGRIVEVSNDRTIAPLGAGIPNEEYLPVRLLSRMLSRVTADRPAHFGSYTDEAGNRELRRRISSRLALRGVHLDADDLLITNGCIGAVSIAVQVATEPGDAIAIEEPVFLGIIQLLAELKREVVPIATSPSEGMNLDQLESVLKAGRISAVIMTAAHQNPTGSVMPVEARRRAVELCSRFAVPLIEDDVYGETSFDHSTVFPLKSFDTAGIVLYCSSVSKMVGPGMRVGWLAAGTHHEQARNLNTATQLGTSPILQDALAQALSTSSFDRSITRLRSSIAQNARDLRAHLIASIPGMVGISNPRGGYYFWVELEPPVDSLDLFERALAAGVGIVPGPAFCSTGRFRNYIRLSFGSPITVDVRAAVDTLARLCRS